MERFIDENQPIFEHFVGTVHTQNQEALRQRHTCLRVMQQLATNMGLGWNEYEMQGREDGGFSLLIDLIESHIAIQTSIDSGTAQIDIAWFDYNDSVPTKGEILFNTTAWQFYPKDIDKQIINRP